MNDFFRRSWMREARTLSRFESTLRSTGSTYHRANSTYQSARAAYQSKQNLWTYAALAAAQKNLKVAAANYEQSKVNYASAVGRSSPLFRSHPVNQERIQTVSAVSRYAAGLRSLNSFSSHSRIFQTISVLNDVENRERALPFFRRSKKSLAAGDTERALELLEEAIGEDPKYADAWSAIGDTYMDRREGIPAAQAFERARSADPREFHEEWKLGWAYAATRRDRLAAQEFQKAIRRDKKNASLRVALADSHMRVNQPKKALKQYNEASKLSADPGRKARLYLKIASCYEALGKDSEARKSLQKSVREDPACTDCRARLQEFGLRP